MLSRIWAIALNTFREAARIRVLYGAIVVVVAANLLALVLGRLSLHEETRVAQDIGLAGISVFGALTAIVLGSLLLYTEVQRRTIHAIVSKPIARWEFVVGKYLGMALVLTVLVGLFGVAMAAMLTAQGDGLTAEVFKAVVLAWFEVLVVAAIAVFFSSFSSPFLSGIFALAMWVLGRLTPDIEIATARHRHRSASPRGSRSRSSRSHLFSTPGTRSTASWSASTPCSCRGSTSPRRRSTASAGSSRWWRWPACCSTVATSRNVRAWRNPWAER